MSVKKKLFKTGKKRSHKETAALFHLAYLEATVKFLNSPICCEIAQFCFILISGFVCFLITPALPETLRAKIFLLSKPGFPAV